MDLLFVLNIGLTQKIGLDRNVILQNLRECDWTESDINLQKDSQSLNLI